MKYFAIGTIIALLSVGSASDVSDSIISDRGSNFSNLPATNAGPKNSTHDDLFPNSDFG